MRPWRGFVVALGGGEHAVQDRDPANGYTSVEFPVEDGMELSCWVGRE